MDTNCPVRSVRFSAKRQVKHCKFLSQQSNMCWNNHNRSPSASSCPSSLTTMEEDEATMSVNKESADEIFTAGPKLDMDSPFSSPINEPQFHPLTKDTEFSCGPGPMFPPSPVLERPTPGSQCMSESSPSSPQSFASLSSPPFKSLVSHQSYGSASPMSQSFSHSLPTAGSLLSPTTHLFGLLTTPTHHLPPASQIQDVPLLGSPWHLLDRQNPSSSRQSVPSTSNCQPSIVINLTESPLRASTTPQSPSQSATSPRGPQHGGKHKSMQYPQSVITFPNW